MSRGYFAIGVERPKTASNIGTLWRTANIFGAAFIFTIGHRYHRHPGDTMQTPRHVPLFHFDSLEAMQEHLPEGCELIAVEMSDKARLLADFKHPERAAYLLGSEDKGLSDAALSASKRHVKIPGERSINVAVAGSIVLYDRISS